MKDRPGFNRLLQEVSKEAAVEAGRRSEHPDAAVLLAYHEKELSSEDRGRVMRHLANCSVCTQTVLDLKTFPALADDEAADEADAVHRESRERLFSQLEVKPQRPLPRREGGGVQRMAIAALLAGVVLGWMIHGATRSTRDTVPQTNLFVHSLFPADTQVRGSESQDLVEVPADMETVVWILAYDGIRESGLYSAEILTSEGQTIQRWDGLERSAEGWFSIAMDRTHLEDAPYLLRLVEVSSETEVLAEYSVRIAPDRSGQNPE